MSFSLVINTIAQSGAGGTITTGAINTTGANLIIIFTESIGGALSDSKSNTWSNPVNVVISGVTLGCYYCLTPTVGSGHTFTCSGSFPAIAVAAWSGAAAASVLDQTNSDNSATPGTTKQPGSVTPTQDNELLMYAVAQQITTTVSVNIGAMLDQAALIGGQAFSLADAYQIQTTATTRNPQFSWSGAQTTSAAIMTFKAAAGGSIAVKTFNGIAQASVKNYNALINASTKTVNGVANV